MDITTLVEKYLKIRDKKAELKAKFTKDTEALDHALEVAENAILAFFNEHGMDSASCANGTAYKSTRTSATVADWDAALEFIKTGERWEMLERRVSKAAVEAYVESEGDLPPGVNWKADVTINVRRS